MATTSSPAPSPHLATLVFLSALLAPGPDVGAAPDPARPPASVTVSSPAAPAPGSPAPTQIHVNRLGFYPGEPKSFVATADAGASSFTVVDPNGTQVFRGTLAAPLDDPLAVERARRGDFSGLTQSGVFRIRLSDGSTSGEFPIGRNVLENLYRHAIHGLYLSRCGYPVTDDRVGHPACHLRDGGHRIEGGRPIPDARHVSGAWHNGGDYRRSTLSAAQAVSRLLWVAEFFPGQYEQTPSLLLPAERSARLPDLLVEARWGLDWLMRMMDASGGVSLGLGPAPDAPRMPPQIPPQDDTLHNAIGAVHSCNTAKTGAVLARAARLFRGTDAAFATQCLAAAKKASSWLEANPKPSRFPPTSTCQIYIVNATDAEDRLWLALELFRTTGDERYHAAFKRRYAALENKFPPLKASTQTMRTDNYREALISYTFEARADAAIKAEILGHLTASCDAMVGRSDRLGYGNILPSENWQHRHTIGNNLHLAFALLSLHRLTGNRDYLRVARRQLDYVLGVNPLDQLYVTGLEPNGIQAPHYRPYSIRHLAPVGLTVKGPTHDPEFLQKTYAGRPVPPPMKAYVDRPTSHWCNEPDIEVQGYLVLFAGYFHFSHVTGDR